jgi:hypothetical protein
MVAELLSTFDQLYSIELSDKLYHRAKKIFRKYEHLHLLHGDSGLKISTALDQISVPTLFWLDAHYSGSGTARGSNDTPVLHELSGIFNHQVKNHHILIDDARLFGVDPAYPTQQEVVAAAKKHGYQLVGVVSDIMYLRNQK